MTCGTLKCCVVLITSVDFTFIKCFIQTGATWWKTTDFSIIKNIMLSYAFLLPDINPYIMKNQVMFDASDILLQNAFETTSPITIQWILTVVSWLTFRHASLHISSNEHTPSRYLGRPCLLIHCCCQFYSATLFLLNVLCSRQIADFRQAAPPTLSYLELMNMQSTQCVQNKTAFNCGKNRANSFGRFEQSNVVTSVFWAILYFSGVCVCVWPCNLKTASCRHSQ